MATVVGKPSSHALEGIVERQQRAIRRLKGLLIQTLPIINPARRNSRGTEELYQQISKEIDQKD